VPPLSPPRQSVTQGAREYQLPPSRDLAGASRAGWRHCGKRQVTLQAGERKQRRAARRRRRQRKGRRKGSETSGNTSACVAAHICTGTGLARPTSAPGLGSPLPHLICSRKCHRYRRRGRGVAQPAGSHVARYSGCAGCEYPGGPCAGSTWFQTRGNSSEKARLTPSTTCWDRSVRRSNDGLCCSVCLLHVAWWLLRAAWLLLHVAWCQLHVAWCLLHVACLLLLYGSASAARGASVRQRQRPPRTPTLPTSAHGRKDFVGPSPAVTLSLNVVLSFKTRAPKWWVVTPGREGLAGGSLACSRRVGVSRYGPGSHGIVRPMALQKVIGNGFNVATIVYLLWPLLELQRER
jgi:hypothetical protein